MIDLGFKNWIACEAESRADALPEPDNSREIRGMDPHDLQEWIMNVP